MATDRQFDDAVVAYLATANGHWQKVAMLSTSVTLVHGREAIAHVDRGYFATVEMGALPVRQGPVRIIRNTSFFSGSQFSPSVVSQRRLC